MNQYPVSKYRSHILVAALCILSASIGYQLGEKKTVVSVTPQNRVVINQQAPASASVDFSLFWTVWQKLFQTYIDRATLEPQKLVWGAISGMVSAVGDPYTLFLPPKENKDFKEDIGGQFEGIGAQLGMKDDHVIVVSPLKGNPAEKAGILPGDYILKVNDEDTAGWTIAQTVTKIRGPRGTTVKLTILHEKGTKAVDISIVRNTITVASVDSWVKKPSEITEITGVPSYSSLTSKAGKVAYIRLSRFGDHSNDEWDKAVSDLNGRMKADSSIKGLIFDLRNNPGGYLEGAVYIGSEFIKHGLVASQVNSNGTKEEYPVNRVGKFLTTPVVVLINKGSASAAEIVAGALHDHGRATLVGETSFGKGSVQTPEDLDGGAGLHITTGKWLLPKGKSISKIGVTPNVIIETDYTEATKDAQLARAIEELLK